MLPLYINEVEYQSNMLMSISPASKNHGSIIPFTILLFIVPFIRHLVVVVLLFLRLWQMVKMPRLGVRQSAMVPPAQSTWVPVLSDALDEVVFNRPRPCVSAVASWAAELTFQLALTCHWRPF